MCPHEESELEASPVYRVLRVDPDSLFILLERVLKASGDIPCDSVPSHPFPQRYFIFLYSYP